MIFMLVIVPMLFSTFPAKGLLSPRPTSRITDSTYRTRRFNPQKVGDISPWFFRVLNRLDMPLCCLYWLR